MCGYYRGYQNQRPDKSNKVPTFKDLSDLFEHVMNSLDKTWQEIDLILNKIDLFIWKKELEKIEFEINEFMKSLSDELNDLYKEWARIDWGSQDTAQQKIIIKTINIRKIIVSLESFLKLKGLLVKISSEVLCTINENTNQKRF